MNIQQEGRCIVSRFVILLVGVLFLFVGGCGTQDGVGTTQTSSGTVVDATGSTITLSSSLGTNELLAQRGTATITAYVTNSVGEPADGYEVTFWAENGVITEKASTVAGFATATYFAGTAGGRVSIKAGTFAFISSVDGTLESSGVEDEIIINVASGPAAAFQIVSIEPQRLGLRGSGSNEVATLTFSLTDTAGNPVADGQVVNFSLHAPTGGAEFISASSASTIDGEVFVLMGSGDVAGVATVTASTESELGTIATEARVTMGYSKPDQNHISIAAETLNVPGLVRFGIENKITAYIADRFSNPVPAGTPVFFASECGIMALEDSSGVASNLTNNFGIATATSITAQPASSLCRMLVWTEGEEAYTDSNGNGVYDEGEPHEGIGEPFIDANDNEIFDSSELYFDLDNNGAYTSADNGWDADTFVWTSQNVRWSGRTAAPTISPASVEIAAGDTQEFTITVADVNGNPLPAGSKLSVSGCFVGGGLEAGPLSGDTDITMIDSVFPGSGTTQFTVRLPYRSTSNPADYICQLEATVTSEINGTRTSSAAITLKGTGE